MENQDTKTKENSTWSKQSEDDQKEGRCRKGDGKDFRNMSNERVKIQPAVKKETEKVAAGTAIGVILMWVVFGILHVAMPEKVPFDYTVILGGLCGGIVAVLNFFTMGITVQRIVSLENQDAAQRVMRSSYSKRMFLQLVWCIVAITTPYFQFAAGLLPLHFPGAAIKIAGIFGKKKDSSGS